MRFFVVMFAAMMFTHPAIAHPGHGEHTYMAELVLIVVGLLAVVAGSLIWVLR
jgi:hypothetical protein